MNKKTLVLAVTLLATVTASAQRYNKVVRNNFWNDGSNVTGIRQDTVSVSYAEAAASFQTGGLRGASSADKAWTAGATAATVHHLKKFSLKGTFGFEQFWGSGMGGSMFVRPDFFPVNVYEFTPGNKLRQTYSFDGGVSVDISDNWRIGGKLDFLSSNFAKRKDLRHTTWLLDLSVAPGFMYHDGDFAIGANYLFRKVSETVNAEQVGSTVSGYEAFFDKGLYYGVRQLWTGSGVHLSESGVNGLPVAEIFNGLTIQTSYRGFYLDAAADYRVGKAGEKEHVWYRFAGFDLSSHAGYRFSGESRRHVFRASFDLLNQDNNETVREKITEGGVTNEVEYGAVRVFSRNIVHAGLDYENGGGRWTFGGKLSLTSRKGTVSVMYPYVGNQSLFMPCVDLRASCRIAMFTLKMAVRWSDGRMKDGQRTVVEEYATITVPERLESYYMKYKEHMTSEKIVLSPGVTCDFPKGFYAAAACNWEKGFGIRYLAGSTRTFATLKFGYNF